jgi:hypothetical protein
MWYLDPLLGNDHEISNYITAVSPVRKQQHRKGVSIAVRAEML